MAYVFVYAVWDHEQWVWVFLIYFDHDEITPHNSMSSALMWVHKQIKNIQHKAPHGFQSNQKSSAFEAKY